MSTSATPASHRQLIDPLVLLFLFFLSLLVLVFLFFQSHAPEIIKPASFKSTLNCFNLFLVLLVILFRVFDPEDNGPSTNKVVENYQNLGAVVTKQWIVVRKPRLQVSDDTAEITSLNDQRKKERRQYRSKKKKTKKAKKAPQIPSVTTSLPSSPSPSSPSPSSPSQSSSVNLFTPRNKIKNLPSSENSKLLPQQLTPQHDRNTFTSSTSQSSWTPQPHQPKQETQHCDRHTSMSSSSESSYKPQPPPPPPFDMPKMRHKSYNLVSVRSFSSNTSSSPDIQPMSQPSTAMDCGDINAKAGIFISNAREQWKMEQEYTVNRKGSPSSINIIFNSGNKNIKPPPSKTTPLPPTQSRPQPPPPPPPQPKPTPQYYYRQTSISTSSQPSYIPQPPSPLDMPVMSRCKRRPRQMADKSTPTLATATTETGAKVQEDLPRQAIDKGKGILIEEDVVDLMDIKPSCYINPLVPEADHIRIRNRERRFHKAPYLRGQLSATPSHPLMLPTSETHAQKPEIPQGPISLGLLTSLNPQTYMEYIFTTEAKIVFINEENGWYFNKCRKCHMKIEEGHPHSHCQEKPTPNYSYCFKTMLEDTTGSIIMTCFSPEANSMLPPVTEVLSYIPDPNPYVFPQIIRDLLDINRIFRLRFATDSRKDYMSFILDSAADPSQPILPAIEPAAAAEVPQPIPAAIETDAAEELPLGTITLPPATTDPAEKKPTKAKGTSRTTTKGCLVLKMKTHPVQK